MNSRTRAVRLPALLAAVALAATACTVSVDSSGTSPDVTGTHAVDELEAPSGDCTSVHTAVSSEKIDLMRALASEFNSSAAAAGGEQTGGCVRVTVVSKPSGGAADALSSGWNVDVDGPHPTVWSPAASTWGEVVNFRLEQDGQDPIVADQPPFMQTPLVIAMPEPMAEALGYPDTPLGWSDILELARSEAGWSDYGHPEWGQFKLGKTNPNFSTSGLAALAAQSYAAAGKTAGLTSEDLSSDEVVSFATDVESAVVHYGDTTMTFLNNWYRNDQRGTAMTYASAAAVEEVSVVQYNRGNPDGILQPGEQPTAPRVPLVAVYPDEGTLFSDNPFIILDADWVSDEQAAAAKLFRDFVFEPANQQRVLEFGFRPGNVQVPIAAPITPEFGVDPDEPSTTLQVPSGALLDEMISAWHDQRKSARVLLLLDVSGSMGDPAGVDNATKLDLATAAASRALNQFADHDQVGLRIFSTDMGGQESADWVDLVDIGPSTSTTEQMQAKLRTLSPVAGTPLYQATVDSYTELVDGYDADAINAVVVLSDGRNEHEFDDLQQVLATLTAGSEGSQSRPVRVFTIGYGADADMATLTAIAEATDAKAYDASDPATIDRVFTSVISNF